MAAEKRGDASMPAVTLDFGNRSGAWDDRELVNAYDAALLEFHIHNPGPGSWLDKATAALAKGQALPGANAFGTEWYAAAKREVDAETAKEEATAQAAQDEAVAAAAAGPSKKKRRTTQALPPNPYTPSGEVGGASRASPSYAPPSPSPGNVDQDVDVDVEEEYGDDADADAEVEDEAEWDGAPEWDGNIEGYSQYFNDSAQQAADADPGQIFPPPSGEWQPATATSVTRDEAIGYALHAQYWAGYWMGVARGSGRGQPGQAGNKRRAAVAAAQNGGGPGRANSTTTPPWARQRRPAAGGSGSGLRR